MRKLHGKNVFITGASEGIGKACAFAFADCGANLIISSRRLEKISEVAEEIKKEFDVEVHPCKLDVRNKDDVKSLVNSLPEEFKKIDILINNAGLARGLEKLYKDDPEGWDEMIDTNIKGLLYVTREIVPQMVERKEGHVINLGSIAGHEAYPKGSVYCSTKHAVDAITKSLRQDVIESNVKVSTVDPGMVETNFSNIRFRGDTEKAKKVYDGLDPLTAEDIADAVIYCATRSKHVNINQIVIMPTAQANSYVNFRK